MSKEANSIYSAFQLGAEDKRNKKPYNNPFCKNKQKSKFKAYKNGYTY